MLRTANFRPPTDTDVVFEFTLSLSVGMCGRGAGAAAGTRDGWIAPWGPTEDLGTGCDFAAGCSVAA